MGTGAFILAALKILPLILNLVSMFKRSADEKVQRGLGYDQAVKEAFEEGAENMRRGNAAEEQARKDHATKLGDDAFDSEFQRKD